MSNLLTFESNFMNYFIFISSIILGCIYSPKLVAQTTDKQEQLRLMIDPIDSLESWNSIEFKPNQLSGLELLKTKNASNLNSIKYKTSVLTFTKINEKDFVNNYAEYYSNTIEQETIYGYPDTRLILRKTVDTDSWYPETFTQIYTQSDTHYVRDRFVNWDKKKEFFQNSTKNDIYHYSGIVDSNLTSSWSSFDNSLTQGAEKWKFDSLSRLEIYRFYVKFDPKYSGSDKFNLNHFDSTYYYGTDTAATIQYYENDGIIGTLHVDIVITKIVDDTLNIINIGSRGVSWNLIETKNFKEMITYDSVITKIVRERNYLNEKTYYRDFWGDKNEPLKLKKIYTKDLRDAKYRYLEEVSYRDGEFEDTNREELYFTNNYLDSVKYYYEDKTTGGPILTAKDQFWAVSFYQDSAYSKRYTVDGSIYTEGYHHLNYEREYPRKLPNVFPLLTSAENNTTIELPETIILHQNYPNPFNPSTVIQYEIPRASQIKLEVYDLLGRKVAELENGIKAAGTYQVQFDASQLSSGIYVYRLESEKSVISKKMLLIK